MMGIACDYDHHEVAPSQHEIDLKYNDALSIADSVVLAKYVIKKVARESGLYASFMPKPITEVNGSGMHLHLSLWANNKNLFFGNRKEPISDLAKGYIMGLIKYGKEIQAGLNQWVNSYKRLIPGYEAQFILPGVRKIDQLTLGFPNIKEDERKQPGLNCEALTRAVIFILLYL